MAQAGRSGEEALIVERSARLRLARDQRIRVLRRIGVAFGAVAALGGGIAAIGWISGVHAMTTWVPTFIPLRFTTSIGFLIGGLMILVLGHKPGVDRPWLMWIALLATLAPTARTIRYLFDSNGGLSRAIDDSVGSVPISPVTAFAFVLFGCAVAAASRRRLTLAQFLVLVPMDVAVTGLTGYAFNVPRLFASGEFYVLPAHAAVLLLLMSVAILAITADGGFMSLVAGDTAGGVLVRRQLPVVLLLPFCLGALALFGAHLGVYSDQLGYVILIILLSLAGVTVLWLQAYRLRGLDQERVTAQNSLSVVGKALAERDALATQLESVNADLTDFAAMAAHDLRSPLTAIQGYAELIEETLSDEGARELQADWIASIRGAAQRGDDLIADLLNYARIGHVEVDLLQVDLGEMVHRVIAQVPTGGREVDYDVGDLPRIYGDPVMLRQMFTNLLSNAVKFVPDERTPSVVIDSVSTKGDPGDPVQDWVNLRITDNGVGVPPVDRERIFVMFERGVAEGGVTGTGVGLAICRRAIERHGGKIWVEEAPGGGARVVVRLPATRRSD